jgi:transcriptional regulator with XRE-family HTH domain
MDSKEFGRQVKKRRQALAISQEHLATQANISRNYLSIIERGEANNVSVSVLGQLATALGVSPAQLIDESPQPETLIPPALRELGLKDGLSFAVIDRLARIPRHGQEPRTAQEWRKLYHAVRPYLEENN